MIFTFYSFKGGVGRSMALANVADRLARRGLRVLAIDFDLEAPGLERYFPVDKAAALANPGLIDLLRAFKDSLAGRGGSLETAAFRDLSRFVFPIYERVGENGRLDLLPAGCRSAGEGLRRYALEVRTFDWQDFYFNWEGEAFFEWLRRELTGPQGRYDAVLVDSRTGVTEMGGVCAYQLADTVVMMTAANHQNLLGTQDVARDFRSAPVMALRHGRPLELLVVPARIEQRDPALLEAFFQRFQDTFEGQMPAALAGLSARQLAIPYEPEYAFEEVVVTDPARRDRLAGLGAAYERLADVLVMLGDGAMVRQQDAARAALWPATSLRAPAGQLPAQATAAAASPETTLNYDPTQRFAGYDVYLSRSRENALAERLALALREQGLSVFFDSATLASGDDWQAAASQALHHSATLLLCVGASGLSAFQKREVEMARSASRAVRVLPVLLAGADPEIFALSLSGIADLQPVDLRTWPEREIEFGLLLQLLRARAPDPANANLAAAPSFNPYAGLAAGDERHAGLLDLPGPALQALVDGLHTHHVVQLLGPAGAGKSTLVAAGLVPAVRQGALGQPVPELQLIDGRQFSAGLATLAPPDGDASAAPRLCIIDHVDELMPALPGDGTGAQLLQSAWLSELQALARRAHPGWRLLLVGRLGLPPQPQDVALRADGPPPERPRLDVPALRTGMAFEPGLLERLDADVAAGTQPLSLGQLVLPGLWDSARRGFLGNEAYAATGGVLAVFERHVSARLAQVPAELGDAVHAILLWLLQGAGDGGWTWRGATAAQLAQLHGRSEQTWPALRWLVRERVLHLEARDGDWPFCLLAPLPPASCEPVLRLLDEHGPRVRQRGALAFALDRWQRAQRDASALLSGQALADAEGLVADWNAHLSDDMLAFVQASRVTLAASVQQAATAAVATVRERRVQRRLAVLAVLAVVLVAAALYEWRSGLHAEALSDQKHRTDSQLQAIGETANKAAAALAQVSASGAAQADTRALRGARVAIQYRSACELTVVNTLATALGALGAQVDAPQQVDAEVRGDLRFYRETDRATAQHLQAVVADLLATMGVRFRPALNAQPDGTNGVRPGTLELWLPALSQQQGVVAVAPQTDGNGITWMQVPASCAALGSSREARGQLMTTLGRSYFSFLDNDKPPSQRWIETFLIQRTEVTNAQFARYIAQACTGEGGTSPGCPPAWRARGTPDEPARFLGWGAAQAYCNWVGGRLPTEDEWEKAARGTDGRIWPWGNQPDATRFQGKANSGQRLAAVGHFPAGDSPYGVADLAGNLWELTASDWTDGGHVMKGGSYLNDLPYTRASSRWSSSDEDKGSDYLGFRCVIDGDKLR